MLKGWVGPVHFNPAESPRRIHYPLKRSQPPEPSLASVAEVDIYLEFRNEKGQILEEMALEESFVFQNSEAEGSLRSKAAESSEAVLRRGTFETAEAALRSKAAAPP